jgi:hypothetical protein
MDTVPDVIASVKPLPLRDDEPRFRRSHDVAELEQRSFGGRWAVGRRLTSLGMEIARKLGRAPSMISRELRRNAATRGGGLEYRATTAWVGGGRSSNRVRSKYRLT